MLQYLDGVIDVKNGVSEMTFLTPELKPILGKTYGAIVYQEQVMEICQKLAGFTLGHADEVRRFMSKKKHDKLAHERDAFVDGCKANGISEEISNKLFDQMMDFASYAFNKSHAAAYAYNAYITAWLKYYYPTEFYMAALNWARTDQKPQEAVSKLIYEAGEAGIKVLTPDINMSGADFVTDDGNIRFGLSAVKGINKAGALIISERRHGGSFKSLKDFIVRVHPSSTIAQNLISSGAFDCFEENRQSMKSFVEASKKPLSERDKKASFIRSAELVLPVVESFKSDDELKAYQEEKGVKCEIKELTSADKLSKRIENAKASLLKFDNEISAMHITDTYEDKKTRMKNEKDVLGIYVSSHPMDIYPSAGEIGVSVISDATEMTDAVYGLVTNLVVKYRKSDGAPMAFFEIEDKSGRISAACFTKAYKKCQNLLKEDGVYKFYGKVIVEETDSEDEEPTFKFIVEQVKPVREKMGTLLMGVSSYAVFHLTQEEAFKAAYQEDDGYNLMIYDKALDEVRNITYTVSSKVKELPEVEEVFL